MNNNFNGLDLSYSLDLVSSVQKQMKESERVAQRVAEEAYNERLKMQKAIEQTAANTAETNIHLQKVVENQNAYIDLLKDQIAAQKQQLDFAEQQIGILNNIFASDEDGVIVEKEILKLIQNQIDASHPLWDYIKDKGGDIAVSGITTYGPIIWSAIKAYLLSQGINFQ